uniref:Uncharacterized protein n=1 Tax=Anguilla anguilla TaxID=7936 RepID=A0A0E9PJ02_ANGAN
MSRHTQPSTHSLKAYGYLPSLFYGKPFRFQSTVGALTSTYHTYLV